MNGMSFAETVFLFVVALIIFGPKKLPEIARQVGKYLNEFKRASNEFKSQIEQEIAHLDVENQRQSVLRSTAATVEGTTSRTLDSAPAEENKIEAPASTEAPAPETATLASSAEEHVSGSDNGANPPVATEAVPDSQAAPQSQEVTSNTSQESHA
jgi:sec-independent protein translocase protein TatB